MTTLLIIDMQNGLFAPPAQRYDPEGVISRINMLSDAVRKAAGGGVVFVRHTGTDGWLEHGTHDWDILPEIHRKADDPVVEKNVCDAFYRTELKALLESFGTRRLCITGCCTDYCIDTTIRTAASLDYELLVPEDGHTTGDKPTMKAADVIKHHNHIWSTMIAPQPIVVKAAEELPSMF